MPLNQLRGNLKRVKDETVTRKKKTKIVDSSVSDVQPSSLKMRPGVNVAPTELTALVTSWPAAVSLQVHAGKVHFLPVLLMSNTSISGNSDSPPYPKTMRSLQLWRTCPVFLKII